LNNNNPNQDISIFSLSPEQIDEELTSAGFKKFRARQIITWLYKHKATNFDSMKNVPKSLRQYLNDKHTILSLSEVNRQTSKDGQTTKLLLELSDGKRIECVIIRSGERSTLCISSQVGCALDCQFCSTGRMGFIRDLSIGEIVSQLMYTISIEDNIDNIVFMGMGEPLLNYDNVTKAIAIITHPDGLNMSIRRITVSTAGIIDGIKKLISDKLHLRLAVSLNSALESKRTMLMPVNKSNPLGKLVNTLAIYQDETGKRLTLEYVMIDGVNMGKEEADALIALSDKLNFNLNLIPYNKVKEALFSSEIRYTKMNRPSEKTIHKFTSYFKGSTIEIVQRYRKGDDISAACGQLATNSK
jgi:23S rRNA (adenine2503-C2)-methyltransferase